MTDKEIIKAFKCCSDINDKCFECPLKDKSRESCVGILMSNALDLINRQKAYNDMLESLNETNSIMIHELNKSFENIKTNAYKEFADEFNAQLDNAYIQRAGKEYVDFIKAIADNTYKELVGE